MNLEQATILALENKLIESIEPVKERYLFLKQNGFDDITSTIIKQLQDKNKKIYKDVLERINASSYYYIFKKDNNIGLYSTWYVTKKEIDVIKQLTGCNVNSIGHLLDNMGLWNEWVNLVNRR